jgi:hypothetical protein
MRNNRHNRLFPIFIETQVLFVNTCVISVPTQNIEAYLFFLLPSLRLIKFGEFYLALPGDDVAWLLLDQVGMESPSAAWMRRRIASSSSGFSSTSTCG